MFERILNRMRECIRTNTYVVTLHAVEEMDDDQLSVFDVERAVLAGSIRKREKDEVTGENKFHLLGSAVDGREIELIVKLSVTGKLVIITVYAL